LIEGVSSFDQKRSTVSVLGKSEIAKRLDNLEIFVPGSWAADCMRAAGYYLRVAPDYLILPDGTRYWPESPNGETECRASFELAPRDVAFVSSLERLCMPFDLVGNVAQQFGLARQGLLVLGGLLVDPGYGMERNRAGSWAPMSSGERLHFQLANIGSETVIVVPGETRIAGIQFLSVDGDVTLPDESLADLRVPSSREFLNSMFKQGDKRPLPPFAFFPEVKALDEEVDRLKVQGAEQAIELGSTRRSTEQLVVFGVLLLSITLFTVAIAALIEALASGDAAEAAQAVARADAKGLGQDGLVVMIALAIVVGVLCIAMPGIAFRQLRRARAKGQNA
jgi:deoxycytidine triphosphate deaminase